MTAVKQESRLLRWNEERALLVQQLSDKLATQWAEVPW